MIKIIQVLVIKKDTLLHYIIFKLITSFLPKHLVFIDYLKIVWLQLLGVTCIAIRLGGRKRNGMYLQAVCLGVSIGSICGPFIARPFLADSTNSHRVRETTWHTDEFQMNMTST